MIGWCFLQSCTQQASSRLINHLLSCALPFVPSVNLLRACAPVMVTHFDFTILWSSGFCLTQLLILRVLYKENKGRRIYVFIIKIVFYKGSSIEEIYKCIPEPTKEAGDKSPSLSILLLDSSKTQWRLSGSTTLISSAFTQLLTNWCGGGDDEMNSNELPISSHSLFFNISAKPFVSYLKYQW